MTLTILLTIFSDAGISHAMAFPPLENSDYVILSVSIDFPVNLKWDALFHCIVMTILVLIGIYSS